MSKPEKVCQNLRKCVETWTRLMLSYALCFMLYALCFMLYALRFTLYALRFTLYALRLTLYALRFTLYALRFTLYALCFMLYALCLWKPAEAGGSFWQQTHTPFLGGWVGVKAIHRTALLLSKTWQIRLNLKLAVKSTNLISRKWLNYYQNQHFKEIKMIYNSGFHLH